MGIGKKEGNPEYTRRNVSKQKFGGGQGGREGEIQCSIIRVPSGFPRVAFCQYFLVIIRKYHVSRI